MALLLLRHLFRLGRPHRPDRLGRPGRTGGADRSGGRGRSTPWLLAAALAANPVAAATISGQIVVGGNPFPGVVVAGPKATCSVTDGAGNYSCTVAAPWDGTLAAVSDGYTFNPPAVSFAGQTANVANVNFTAVPAAGLRAELALWRPGTTQFFIDWNVDNQPDLTRAIGAPTDVPLAGDVNGDGITDLVVWRNGVWYADTDLDGVTDTVFHFGGVAGDVPLLADVDGDGSADLVIYRNGTWYASTLRNGAADKVFHFAGQAGDVPLAADFDADGIADLALFRNGTWFIDTDRNGTADLTIGFGGVAGEIPVALDYNGDGRADIGVYRSGIWYVNTNLDGASATLAGYGGPGDRPLAGYFNRAATRFVRAGSACSTACTQANPYGSIRSAWQDAADGDILRIARGTYAESLVFSHPGNQYAPGKFGKNSIKLIGVSRRAVTIAPTSGDAITLQGSTGYQLRGLKLQTAAAGARGLTLVGGPGSVLPSFPGAQVNAAAVDFVENHGQNVLLTGSANAWIRYSKLSRSRASHGMSLWQASYARVVASEISGNGYTVPVAPLPDAGKGFDLRYTSELDARRNTVANNLTFGVIGIDQTVARLAYNTISGSGYNGIIFCGPNANQTVRSYVNSNWIAGNGTYDPASGWNGLEIYTSCEGTHSVTGNTFVGNTLNGAFAGSSTVTFTGNAFRQNRIGISLYAVDASVAGASPSRADTVVTIQGNVFDANTVDGLYAERYAGTTVRKIVATVGGTSTGQANAFSNHVAPAYHAISCLNLTTQFSCPVGGNSFSNNVDDVEAACPASCRK